jgi:cell division protein FtsB
MSLEPHLGHFAVRFTDSVSSGILDHPAIPATTQLVSTKIARVLDIFLRKGYKRYLGPFLQALFQGSKRRAGILLILILASAYGWVFLRGPQGLQTLIEKRREIRELQERNVNIKLENDRRKDRIKRLEESRSEQEMEIRKQLKLQRPGETTFILPESEQKEKAVPSPE